ncbi:MAG: uracil-DNA glycosylase family protein [Clostridia bacterium]|nr:uracil-DNA glycosylase family protein [Clostridia bacterium]
MENIVKEIQECRKCGDLPKLACDSIKFGKSRVLVLGESPAKDGWIQSGRAFFNSSGKLQATGKVLNELLGTCGLSIDDINFTECCKCIISDRKSLRKCMANCKPILFAQLDAFDCDIILPMGQFPTEVILGEKINKLKDFVGREFLVDFGKTKKLVIPIYHTSPANPLCRKGNIPIFEKISKIINQ